AAAHGDLHARVRGLHQQQVAEVPVQPVVGVLPHRTRVEHDHVGHRTLVRAPVTRLLEQAGEALGVVEVHLAPVGAALICTNGVHVNKRGYAHPSAYLESPVASPALVDHIGMTDTTAAQPLPYGT